MLQLARIHQTGQYPLVIAAEGVSLACRSTLTACTRGSMLSPPGQHAYWVATGPLLRYLKLAHR